MENSSASANGGKNEGSQRKDTEDEENEKEEQKEDADAVEGVEMTKSQGTGVFDVEPEQVVGRSSKSKPSKTKVTSTSTMNSNISSVVVPASLVLAGNLLVVIVMVLMSQQTDIWKYIMGFAAIEVLLGSTLWYTMNQ